MFFLLILPYLFIFFEVKHIYEICTNIFNVIFITNRAIRKNRHFFLYVYWCVFVCVHACVHVCVCVCVSVCKCVCVCVCEIHVPKLTSFSLSMIISRLLTTKKISQFIQLCGRISCFSPLYFFQPPPSFMLKTSHTLKIYSYATRK